MRLIRLRKFWEHPGQHPGTDVPFSNSSPSPLSRTIQTDYPTRIVILSERSDPKDLSVSILQIPHDLLSHFNFELLNLFPQSLNPFPSVTYLGIDRVVIP